MKCDLDLLVGRAYSNKMCPRATKYELIHLGTRNANTAVRDVSGTASNSDAAKDAEVKDKQLSKRLGMRGLMQLWDVQKEKQSRSLEEILSPYTESMGTVYCFKNYI